MLKKHSNKFLSSLLKDFLSYGAIGVLSKFVGFFTIPIYARFFSPEQFGVLEIISVLMAILPLLSTLQIETGFLRLFYDNKEGNDKKYLFSAGLYSIILLSAIFTTILLFFRETLTIWLLEDINYAILITLSLLQLPFNNIFGYTTVVFRVEFKRKQYSILHLLFISLNALIGIYAVAVLKSGLLGLILSRTIIVFVFSFISLFMVRHNIIRKFSLPFFKELIAFSAPLIPGAAAYWVQKQISRMFIFVSFDLYHLGIYAIATKLALPVTLIISSLKLAWTPFSYEYFNNEKSKENFNAFLNIVAFLSFIVLIIMTSFSRDIIKLFATEKFIEGYILVGWILLMNIISGYISLISVGLGIKKKTIDWSVITIVGIISSFLAMYFLSIKFEMIGVVVGGFIGETIQLLLMAFMVNRYLPSFFNYSKSFLLLLLGIVYVILYYWLCIADYSLLYRVALSIFMILIPSVYNYRMILTNMLRVKKFYV